MRPRTAIVGRLDNETFEDIRLVIRQEAQKWSESLKTLHAYGIFYTQRGLTPKEYTQAIGVIKNIPFKRSYADMGFSRCNICFVDFTIGEKIKQFPRCEHLFHNKCLDLWLTLDSSCPNCFSPFTMTPLEEPNVAGSISQTLIQSSGQETSTNISTARVHPEETTR